MTLVCLLGKVHRGALVEAFAPLLFPSMVCWIALRIWEWRKESLLYSVVLWQVKKLPGVCFPGRGWCFTRTSKLSTQITSKNSRCFCMGDYSPWQDLLDSLGQGLQKKQTKKQKLKIPGSASSWTCPPDVCSHACCWERRHGSGSSISLVPSQVQEELQEGCGSLGGQIKDESP